MNLEEFTPYAANADRDMSSSFASDIVDVVAGAGVTKLHAHAAVLSHSPKLKALIEGGWADRRKITLPDWDEETVTRLLEWLYSGDYTSPLPRRPSEGKSRKQARRAARQVGKEEPDDTASAVLAREDYNTTYEPHHPIRPICDIDFEPCSIVLPTQFDQIEAWSDSVNEDISECKFEATLFAHAKLYALANYMLLPDLQWATFKHIKSWLTIIGDIGQLDSKTQTVSTLDGLSKYVYANTDGLTRSKEEPLRELVGTYIASNFTHFRGESVRKLIEEGGELVADLWEKASRCGLSLAFQLESEGIAPSVFWPAVEVEESA